MKQIRYYQIITAFCCLLLISCGIDKNLKKGEKFLSFTVIFISFCLKQITFCYVSAAKLLLSVNIQKIFITFCLKKRRVITYQYTSIHFIFHSERINPIIHFKITQREKNKIEALIPQKSIRPVLL